MIGPPLELQTRPSLLQCLRDTSDARSWTTFVSLYAPLVYRSCRRSGLQDADAADVTQEVLVRVAGALRTFQYQPERGRFRDWLRTVTWNQLADFLGRQARARARMAPGQENCLAGAAAPEADSAWTADFNAQVLRLALERIRPVFTPVSWRAFELTWFEGQTSPEAARALDLPIDAVYVAKSRILKRLRAEILILADDLPYFTPL